MPIANIDTWFRLRCESRPDEFSERIGTALSKHPGHAFRLLDIPATMLSSALVPDHWRMSGEAWLQTELTFTQTVRLSTRVSIA